MFSKGNLTERKRLVDQVKEGETIVDMFSGIGYFSLGLAKFSKAKKIYAIELNPESYHYLWENIKLNKVEDKIIPVFGNCGEECKRIGRIADIYIEQEAFITLEKKIFELLDGIPEEKRRKISISDLLFEFGRQLEDEDSLLFQCARSEVPIFCPGLADSMIGYHLWSYSRSGIIGIDAIGDLDNLSERVFEAKKTGAIILGGGLPKHFILGANMLRDGVDAAFQITLDRPEGGSLSGAPLEEAISWRKAQENGRFCTVIGDATICFPLIVSSALDSIGI